MWKRENAKETRGEESSSAAVRGPTLEVQGSGTCQSSWTCPPAGFGWLSDYSPVRGAWRVKSCSALVLVERSHPDHPGQRKTASSGSTCCRHGRLRCSSPEASGFCLAASEEATSRHKRSLLPPTRHLITDITPEELLNRFRF